MLPPCGKAEILQLGGKGIDDKQLHKEFLRFGNRDDHKGHLHLIIPILDFFPNKLQSAITVYEQYEQFFF